MKGYTISQIKDALDDIEDRDHPFILNLQRDPRKGVQTLLDKWQRGKARKLEELERYGIMSVNENRLMAQGYEWIAGIDEAGRGPLAGPVVSAAVILKEDCYIPGLDDSKKLSESKRLELFREIHENAAAIGIGVISAEEIDTLNIYNAVKKSMNLAVSKLKLQPDFLLIDAMKLDIPYSQESIIKGDANSISIAAASIIAKVTRDEIMQQYHEQFPQYGFTVHKGYGTKIHLDALQKYGPCPIHRKSFGPVQAAITRM